MQILYGHFCHAIWHGPVDIDTKIELYVKDQFSQLNKFRVIEQIKIAYSADRK